MRISDWSSDVCSSDLEGRITPGCTGLWSDTQIAPWRRINDFIHRTPGARICLQIGHAGSKGSTRVAWEGIDKPLEGGNWPLVAPSDVPYTPDRKSTRLNSSH